MPSLGEVEENEGRPESSNGATDEAERLPQAMDGNAVPPVEGAHSDEVKSLRSDSDEGSRGGNRRLPPLLGDFDVLRFKNAILEVVEELRMRRIIDAENEERIKSLMTDKHELEQKLEEEHANYEAVIEGHTHSEQELKRSYEEQLKQAEEDVTRSKLTAESKEQEAKALKDEIRSLHLTRYNLEKKVQEQERQLHLQGSSKENYLSQVNQLEQNCLSVSRQASEVTEQIERLEANVKQATELHKKLEYVNEHQKCELKQSHDQLEQCRRELLESRVMINSERERAQTVHGDDAKTRANSHELRMQIELNQQLQEQLSALREEHQSIIQQLKEAHSLVVRHIENSTKLSATEVVMEEEVRALRETNEELQQKLATSTQLHEIAVENHFKEMTHSNERCCDLEQRLKTLQADYTALQTSHDQLEEDRLVGGRDVQSLKEDLEKLKDELKKAEDEIRHLNKDNECLSEKTEQLQLELEREQLQVEHQESTWTIVKLESESADQKEVLQPQSLVSPASLSYKGKLEDSGKTSNNVNTSTSSVLPNRPSLSPVLSPEVILISPPLNFTAAKSTPPDSPPQRDTKDSNDMTMTTNDKAHHSMLQQLIKSPHPTELPVADVSSSHSIKRTANHERDEECAELQSPGKRAKLDLAGENDNNCEISEKVTKVADSPANEDPVKDEPVSDKEVQNIVDNDQPESVQKEDTKLEQVCTENESICVSEGWSLDNESIQVQSSKMYTVSAENIKLSGSQGIARLKFGDVVAPPNLTERQDNEQGDPAEIQVMFSDEEVESAANIRNDEKMLSSQMNRQIDRVQMFLKLERLKRPKI